ncbi:acyltransferase family protein [Serratia marcescens]|uniref:acyltransferase family protein n=1 Tax=Serratia marcescens TaxID=615 RepID=UPI000D72B54B|nr:acyltransferase family protein [Serratia marcescens]AWQ46766.1 hypothetical protein B1A42_05240 [Serratia marcescens]
MDFRRDINGLRAYAVIVVLLFHFKVFPFSGGFLGVDVFFVISGFLMTGIITSKMEKGSFSILGFYSSRCRRIIPPLVVLCGLLLVLGFFLVPNDEYMMLSKHVASSLLFVSNVVYYLESGYFDAESSYKWLLHTWSLSVEWQFYIILPIVLTALHKYLRKYFNIVMVCAAIVSFAIALWLSKNHASFSYFNLPSRAWEMLSGGLVYLYGSKKHPVKHSKLITTILLFVIVIGSMCFNELMPWPGVTTLVPVVATALIIYINGDSNIALNNFVAQRVGRWSYSIYLYHWPLLVFFGLLGYELSLFWKIVLLIVSVFLGALSYKYIESGSISKSLSIKWVLTSTVVISAVGLSLSKVTVPDRETQYVVGLEKVKTDYNMDANKCLVMDGAIFPKCILGSGNENVDLIVIGDSHAFATVSAVLDGRGKGKSVFFIAESGCPTVLGISTKDRRQCGEFVKNAFDFINKEYPTVPVLVINRTSFYLHGDTMNPSKGDFSFQDGNETITEYGERFNSSVKAISNNRFVFIATPIPEFNYDVLFRMTRDAMIGINRDIRITKADYEKRNSDANDIIDIVSERNKNVVVLDTSKYLCDNNYCYGVSGNVPLYRDSNHLSEVGNKKLTPMFDEMWGMVFDRNL